MPLNISSPEVADSRLINQAYIIETHTFTPIGQTPFRRYKISKGHLDGDGNYTEIKVVDVSVGQAETAAALQSNPDILTLYQTEKALSYGYLIARGDLPSGDVV